LALVVSRRLAIGGVAQAADLPAPAYKAPVVAAPIPYNWTGFYIGGNGGYSWGNANDSDTFGAFPIATGSTNMNGWVAGGQLGYNWQVNNYVFGLEADAQGTGQRGTFGFGTGPVCPLFTIAVLPCVTSALGVEEKLPWFGTFRGRLGFTPFDRGLLYVTGGLAVGQVDTNATLTATTAFLGGPPLATATAAASASTTRVGWTVGAGFEWAVWDNWTAKVEYLYLDLGTVSDTFTGLGAATLVTSSRITDNIARFGINYRFGAPPPAVVTRY